jgi:hypothetical protein
MEPTNWRVFCGDKEEIYGVFGWIRRHFFLFAMVKSRGLWRLGFCCRLGYAIPMRLLYVDQRVL